jgi:hypothetical protein
MPTHYEILNIQSSADLAEVKSAYRRLAHVYHPNKGTNSDAAKYNNILIAYKILSDSENRQRYDKQLLNPADVPLIINISQVTESSQPISTSTALVSVTSYNLSELIAISVLPPEIIIFHLEKNAELALSAWKSKSFQNALNVSAWARLAKDFYEKHDSRLLKLIIQTLATNKDLHNQWETVYLKSLACLNIELFTLIVDLKLADDFSGLDFFITSLKIKPTANFIAVISRNTIYNARYHAFSRISQLKSLSDTTIDSLNHDIDTALPEQYNYEVPKYLNANDNELLIFYFKHPKFSQGNELSWATVAEKKLQFAQSICEAEEIKEWYFLALIKLANISASIYSTLLRRELLIECKDEDIVKLQAKYPEVKIDDEKLKQKVKNFEFLTDNETLSKMTPEEIVKVLSESAHDNDTIFKFLMCQRIEIAIAAVKSRTLFKKVFFTHRWVNLACEKLEFAPYLAASPHFNKGSFLTSEMVARLALTGLQTALIVLNNNAAKSLNGNDLQLILNNYQGQIQDEISKQPEMIEKLYANHQAKQALSNAHKAVIGVVNLEQSTSDDLNTLYKMAVVTQSIPLFKSAIIQYRHKASFVQILKIGGVEDFKFCYSHCENDPDLKELKNAFRIKLFALTKETRYKSPEQLLQDARDKKLHHLAASIQCLYFALRDTTLFTFFRSNFFDEYKNFQTISDHAKTKPRSRTAVCFELIMQIEIFTAAKEKRDLIKKIELSECVHAELKNNETFYRVLIRQHPEFMAELFKQSINDIYDKPAAKISLFTPLPEQLIIDRNLTKSNEGNPAILNCHL